MSATKYYDYVLRHPARALYANLVTATKADDNAKTKYSVKLGLEAEDAQALFEMSARAVTEHFGPFTGPDNYQLCCTSGVKAAERAILTAELKARGKPVEEAEKIKERAQAQADLLRPFAGILTASSRVAFHDRFLDRYNDDLDQKERENADRFGFKLGVIGQGKVLPLDTQLSFQEYKDKFYRGCYVGGSFNLSPWARKKPEDKDGVSAYIRNIVWVKDGERLTAERSLADEFSHYMGAATAYDPTTGTGQAGVDTSQF
jgi:hypothetical protein